MTTIHVMHVIQEVKGNRQTNRLSCILLLLLSNFFSNAQNNQVYEGTVSYVNTENIYVRFENANFLKVNDTLQVLLNGNWCKALIVSVTSSRSCITKSIIKDIIPVNASVRFFSKLKIQQNIINEKRGEEKVQIDSTNKNSTTILADSIVKKKQTFDGRFYISSYGSVKGGDNGFNQLRASFSFDINNISNGKFSFQNYFNYRPRFGIDNNTSTFADDFKVYSLALTYDINATSNIVFGRKINNRIANMGAVDGLQFEHKYKHFVFGGFGGFCPDFLNYSFNPSLLQYGGFLAHEVEKSNGSVQTSFAIAEQRNNANIDRRFIYVQHSSTLLKNISLFYSLELDLYQNVNNVATNKIQLTSTYLSLRYRPFKGLNFTASYDNRRNVIYYETYRTYIDQLINQETRQGIRLQVNHTLSKYMSLNFAGFYRYQESRTEPTKNYVVNFTLSQILGNSSYLNFNLNTLETYYFNGNIFGARLNKDIFKSKISTELSYRKVDYAFFNETQQNLQQDIVGISANYYGKKRTSIMLSYEGTFEPDKQYNRYFITISQRFRSKK